MNRIQNLVRGQGGFSSCGLSELYKVGFPCPLLFTTMKSKKMEKIERWIKMGTTLIAQNSGTQMTVSVPFCPLSSSFFLCFFPPQIAFKCYFFLFFVIKCLQIILNSLIKLKKIFNRHKNRIDKLKIYELQVHSQNNKIKTKLQITSFEIQFSHLNF